MNGPLCDDPAIVVACPRCATAGRVRFSLLPHVVRCPRCAVRFWIGRDGHVKSEDEARLVRFVCPRCSQKEWMPADFLAAGAHCRTCDGRFYPDEEGQFHPHPPPRTAERSSDRRPPSNEARPGRSRRWPWAAPILIVGILLTVGAAAWSRKGAESPRGAVLDFTRACLAGRFEDARTRVPAEELRSFDVWAAINFPHAADPMAPKPVAPTVSIIEVAPDEPPAHADAGAAVEHQRNIVTNPERAAGDVGERNNSVVSPSTAAGDCLRVRLLLGGEGEGQRMQTQFWRRGDSGWQFDPVRTLAALGPPDEPRAVTRPKPPYSRQRR